MNQVTFDLDLFHGLVITIALLGLNVKVRGQDKTLKVKLKGRNAVVGRQSSFEDSFLVFICKQLSRLFSVFF